MRSLALLVALTAGPALAQPATALVPGTAVAGDLTPASDTLPDGRFAATYAFEVSGPFEVRLTSPDFDTFLSLTSPTGETYTNDDFGGSTAESRLRVQPKTGEHGRWRVKVTAYQLRVAGAYEVAHRTLTSGEMDAARADDLALDRADSLWTLTTAFYEADDYSEATPRARDALAIREGVLGADHSGLAEPLLRLAWLLERQLDKAAAFPLYVRALAIREATFGPNHPAVANALKQLGDFLRQVEDYAAARPLLERVLAIREETLGSDHLTVAAALVSLANLTQNQGDYTAARPLYERALTIQERALGPDHRTVAFTLYSLGYLLQQQRDYAEALPLFEQAAGIFEAARHPGFGMVLKEIAAVQLFQGDRAAALPLAERVALMQDAYAKFILPTLAPAEQQAYVTVVQAKCTDLLLSALTPAGPATAYGAIAGWKGLLTHGLRRQTAIAHLAGDPAYAADVARLADLRTVLAEWYGQAGRVPLAAWQARNDSLTAEKEALERSLARALPPGALDDPLDRLGSGGLAKALPVGTAFVDMYRYAHRLAPDSSEARYAAVVTVPGVGPVLVALGAADALDAAADAWLDAVVDGGAAEEELGALVNAAWAPVAAALPPGTARVWVAPDGELVRLPWSVLAEAHTSTESLLVAETGSARDIAAILTAPLASSGPDMASAPSALVVGDVAFGDGDAFAFGPLPGTGPEAAAVAALAGEAGIAATVLTGAGATAGAVTRAAAGASYVHLATHGFFYGESRVVYASRAGGDRPGSGAVNLAGRNPLVESGLAFAGANGGPEGQLTAEELVGIDLSQTRLVVLSACETGRGTEVTGQGVLGLRSALAAAGARSVLMSLWEVPDASTALLMAAFYRGLWSEGLTPAAALRQAQEFVRSDARYVAPVHWAAWTLAGDA